MAANIFTGEPESPVKGAAGGDDTQFVVEHTSGSRTHDIDDGMRERDAVLDIDERRLFDSVEVNI